jgi:hypothetical protein
MGSGARSPTTTGPPCTSPTGRDESGTTNSARVATKNANGSFSGCCARPGSRASGRLWSPWVPKGFEAQADWTNLASPETYLGYEQTQNFASAGGVAFDESRTYVAPDSLRLNHWALSGEWTIESGASVLNRADGRIAFRLHARDVHLVLRQRERGTPVPFQVLIDGEPPGDAHGLDVDEEGHGLVAQPRLYQLLRHRGSIADRTFEITFLAPGIEAYVFTFG